MGVAEDGRLERRQSRQGGLLVGLVVVRAMGLGWGVCDDERAGVLFGESRMGPRLLFYPLDSPGKEAHGDVHRHRRRAAGKAS